jgi:hypothetical protein
MGECIDFAHAVRTMLWHNDSNAQFDRHLGCPYTDAVLLRIFPLPLKENPDEIE